MFFKEELEAKIASDWYAIDYIAFGDEGVKKIGLEEHFDEWNEVKKTALEEAFLNVMLQENVTLSELAVLFEAKHGTKMKKKGKKYAKKVAKKKAKAAMSRAKKRMQKKKKTAKKVTKKLARKLKEHFDLTDNEAVKIAFHLVYVEEALKELLGEDTEGILDILETLTKVYVTNPDLIPEIE